jgi:signal transduction histidine kinase
MRRAVLFRYDSSRRRVRAVGAHGIELERFADLFVTIDSVPVAKQSLITDNVLEVLGADDFDVPQSVRDLLEGVPLVCTPMAASGRFVGVVLSEREADAAEMSTEDRRLLWTIGKSIAMASVAREAAAISERSRQLQQRIDLAREIHEQVVQRLFGISLALSREEPLDADAQRRCATEVQAALGELRAALQRPLGHASRPTASTLTEEIDRQRRLHPELQLHIAADSTVPASLEPLAQSLLIEAIRNARKHSECTSVHVSLGGDERTFTMEVLNDSAAPRSGGAGVGLHLATLEALQHGGVLEYGEAEPGTWSVRLVVPIDG